MARGILEVLLVDAGDLREHNFWWCCLNCLLPFWNETNPYVLIQYGNQKQVSCVAQGEGKKEVWNEKFRFNVEYEGEEDPVNTKLILSIMDKPKLSADYLVGETIIYVKDVLLRGMDKGKVEFGPQIYRVIRSDLHYSGEISVAVTFTKANDAKEEDFRGGNQQAFLNDETCAS